MAKSDSEVILRAALAASRELSAGDYSSLNRESLKPILRSALHKLLDETQLPSGALLWVNPYFEPSTQGRYPSRVVDVMKNIYTPLAISVEDSDLTETYEAIETKIAGAPETGLTHFLSNLEGAHPNFEELSIVPISPDRISIRHTSGDPIPQDISHLHWYHDALFRKERSDCEYIHIRNPQLAHLRKNEWITASGIYIMCRHWATIRPLLYPELRLFLLEMCLLMSLSLVAEYTNEQDRQRRLTDRVHHHAIRATQAFTEMDRYIRMLRDLVAPEATIFKAASYVREYFNTGYVADLGNGIKVKCSHDYRCDAAVLTLQNDSDPELGRCKTADERHNVVRLRCARQVAAIFLTLLGETRAVREPIDEYIRLIFKFPDPEKATLVKAISTFLPQIETKSFKDFSDGELFECFLFTKMSFLRPEREVDLHPWAILLLAHFWLGDRWKLEETVTLQNKEGVVNLHHLVSAGEFKTPSRTGIDFLRGIHSLVNMFGLESLCLDIVPVFDPGRQTLRLQLQNEMTIHNPEQLLSQVRSLSGRTNTGQALLAGDTTSPFLDIFGDLAKVIDCRVNERSLSYHVDAGGRTIAFEIAKREVAISWTGVASA